MGLSAPRKRAKLSHDPNNTNWSRSESKYGQRILEAQGWKPGNYLGAKDASQAKYYTVANSSHIKVALREENLGIGARIGAAGGEWATTGLDGFQDLLGRLNGKTQDEIDQVQKERDTLKRHRYVEKRWGTLRFISGGLLVGDKVEEASNHNQPKNLPLERVDSATMPSTQPDPEDHVQTVKGSIIKRKKKSKKASKREPIEEAIQGDEVRLKENAEATLAIPVSDSNNNAQLRAEKAKRKLLRKQKREARCREISEVIEDHSAPIPTSQTSPVKSETAIKATTALGTLRSGIHTVRQRHIRQKKMAMMDSKALKEVS